MIAVITTLFSRPGHPSPIERPSFQEFKAGIESVGGSLFTASAADSATTLWHKERLVNLTVNSLPPEYDKIVTADSDVLFSDPDWLTDTETLLNEFPIIQPYKVAHWLKEDRTKHERLPIYSFAYASNKFTGSFKQGSQKLCGHFHPGFAWGMRRDFFNIGLPDKLVTGGADNIIALSAIGKLSSSKDFTTTFPSVPFQDYLKDIETKIYSYTNGKLGNAKGKINHIFHGALTGRQYSSRWEPLNNFDPATLISGNQGLYDWQNDNTTSNLVAQYLTSRSG